MIKQLKRLVCLPPALLFVSLIVIFARGLQLNPKRLPSPLLGKPTPGFNLPALEQSSLTLSNQIFLHHVTLLNVWASWCEACLTEVPMLLQIKQDSQVYLVGLDYKDKPSQARQYLQRYGNPYAVIGSDQAGTVAINWGVYGTPETFVIDQQGIIRYKRIGIITPSIWQQHIKPLITQLAHENT